MGEVVSRHVIILNTGKALRNAYTNKERVFESHKRAAAYASLSGFKQFHVRMKKETTSEADHSQDD